MSARRLAIGAAATLAVVLGAGITAAVWPVSGIGEQQQAAGPTPSAIPVPASEPLTFAVVGDSITARSDRNGTDTSAGSWTTYATGGDLELVENGWAQNGARLLEMKDNLSDVDADVLVILAGTNDLAFDVPIADRLAIVGALAKQSGASRIVISAVPPYDRIPTASTVWNAELSAYATANGWQFVDPWSTMRTAGGTFVGEFTPDGIHPTVAAASIAGAAIRAALLESVGVEA